MRTFIIFALVGLELTHNLVRIGNTDLLTQLLVTVGVTGGICMAIVQDIKELLK